MNSPGVIGEDSKQTKETLILFLKQIGKQQFAPVAVKAVIVSLKIKGIYLKNYRWVIEK
jgi:archaellum component FlaG (FlaF/FlaG flagellin family)